MKPKKDDELRMPAEDFDRIMGQVMGPASQKPQGVPAGAQDAGKGGKPKPKGK